jgi:primosomal protein N' (replication factor Y)
MVLLAADRPRLHYYVRSWWQNMLHDKPSSMKLTLDIDPQELS